MLTFEDEPCSDDSLLTSSDNRCQSCNKAIGFNPAFYNASPSQISEKQQKYNLQAHCVYLAYFSKNLIKVGIAHQKRSIIRLCEQGARAAAIIYHCDSAYKARGAEVMIKNDMGISEAVNNSRKMKLLREEYNFDKAKDKLSDLNKAFHESIKSGQISLPKLYDFQEDYLGDNTLKKDIFDVSKASPLSISGKCIGMIGNILLMEQGNQQFMVPVKLFVSHVVTFSEKFVKNDIVPTQMSLF